MKPSVDYQIGDEVKQNVIDLRNHLKQRNRKIAEENRKRNLRKSKRKSERQNRRKGRR